jgi:hypothetical protein
MKNGIFPFLYSKNFRKTGKNWSRSKSMTNKIWDEFRDACNAFFNNYRKEQYFYDNWKENYKHKKAILDELKMVSNEEGSIEKLKPSKPHGIISEKFQEIKFLSILNSTKR